MNIKESIYILADNKKKSKYEIFILLPLILKKMIVTELKSVARYLIINFDRQGKINSKTILMQKIVQIIARIVACAYI